MKVTTFEGIELAEATDEHLVEDAEGMQARWTDYRIPMNAEWHDAMVAELGRRNLHEVAAELVGHRAKNDYLVSHPE